jgi:hypothetical protein
VDTNGEDISRSGLPREGEHVETVLLKACAEYCFCLWRLGVILVIAVLTTGHASGQTFETTGLQPLPPYGVFSTFSAESLQQNKVGFALSLGKSVEPNFYRTVLQLAYGLHDRFEVLMTLPYVWDWQGDVDGFEDVTFGIKHRILDEDKFTPALAYLLMAAPGSGRNELSTGGMIGAGIVITKKIGPFRGHANLIYSKPGDSALHSNYVLNLGTELAVTNNSRVLAEIVGRKDYYKNKINLLEWRLGYRIATTENIFTTIGAGFDIKNRTPDYRLMLSVSVILPPDKRQIQKVYEE